MANPDPHTTTDADAPPGAGTVAAETVILAARLCESLALTAGDWPEARGAAVQAVHLRSRATAARDANARAYAQARRQLRVEPGTETGHDGMLAAALLAAVDTLLSVAATASDTAALAAEIGPNLGADLRPDALGAAEIAAGAAAAVTELVRINLALGQDDPRREQADALLTRARAGAASARQALLN